MRLPPVSVLVLSGVLLSGCPQGGTGIAADPAAAARAASPPPGCTVATEISLPPGFCATVFADGLGYTRHLAVNDNGDVYVAVRGDDGGVVALRDEDGDGRADIKRPFGRDGGTGIGIRDGYLYFAMPTRIVRFRLRPGELLPDTSPEVVVAGFPRQGQHASKTVVFDGDNNLYSNVGAPTNACQDPPRSKRTPGLDPCPQRQHHAGIWRFSADELGQDADSDGVRYASGLRNSVAMDWHPHANRLYVVQHGRDQLSELWPDIYTDAQRAELPAEEFLAVDEGDDFGWPYCFFDQILGRKVLAPEYGGDGTTVGRCVDAKDPLLGFPGHWAPNDLHFYRGRNFPSPYRGGAFVAFHGSWNRAPYPQQGFNVVFVPMRDGRVDGDWQVFADGFAGRDPVRGPGDARYRPSGLAEDAGGRLYIGDSRKGRIWRIHYATPAESGG